MSSQDIFLCFLSAQENTSITLMSRAHVRVVVFVVCFSEELGLIYYFCGDNSVITLELVRISAQSINRLVAVLMSRKQKLKNM